MRDFFRSTSGYGVQFPCTVDNFRQHLLHHNIPFIAFSMNELKTRFFSSLLFCLKKSFPWTGNELAGDDVEKCENSQLTLTNLSHLS